VRDTCTIALSTTTIRTTDLDTVSVVEVTGEIDMANANQLLALLTAAIDRCPAALVVDLSGTAFFYSAGINALVSTANRAQDHGVALLVVADHRAVLQPLRLTGVDTLLTLRPTLDQALAGLRAEPAPRHRQTDVAEPSATR
jgi:anti-anti-sigma factor